MLELTTLSLCLQHIWVCSECHLLHLTIIYCSTIAYNSGKYSQGSIFVDGWSLSFIFTDVHTHVHYILYNWAYFTGLVFTHKNCDTSKITHYTVSILRLSSVSQAWVAEKAELGVRNLRVHHPLTKHSYKFTVHVWAYYGNGDNPIPLYNLCCCKWRFTPTMLYLVN